MVVPLEVAVDVGGGFEVAVGVFVVLALDPPPHAASARVPSAAAVAIAARPGALTTRR